MMYYAGSQDSVFRWLTTTFWALQTGGHIDAPTGHFALYEIPDRGPERRALRALLFNGNKADARIFDSIKAGYYYTYRFRGYPFDYEPCEREEGFLRFERMLADYTMWAGA